jgi:hypothetical protein
MASGSSRRFELMFDTKTNTTDRLTDAVDLLIDFATLGEYGLELAQHPVQACEVRRRLGNRRSTGAWAAAIDRFATQS